MQIIGWTLRYDWNSFGSL